MIKDTLGGGSISNVDVVHDNDIPVYINVYCRLFHQGCLILFHHLELQFFIYIGKTGPFVATIPSECMNLLILYVDFWSGLQMNAVFG